MKDEKVKLLTCEMMHRHILSVWFCIKRVIDNNVPTTPADVAFLMQLMSKFATQNDKHVADNPDTWETDMITIKLNRNQMIGAWHCCNVVMNNDMYDGDKTKEVNILESMSIMAKKIDEAEEQSGKQLTLV